MKETPPRLPRRFFRSLAALAGLALTTSFAFGQTAGQVEFDSANYSVNEQAAFRTVLVKRTGGSDGEVTVTYASTDGTATAPEDYIATSGTLMFGDGETEKAISVQICNDTLIEAAETFSLTLDSADPQLLGPNATALFTINDSPTISAIATQTTAIGTATSAIAFTLGDAETAVEDLVLTAFTTNPVLLPPGGIVLGGSGDSRTVTLTPAEGLTGTAPVTLQVTDAGGAVAVRTFVLTVGSTASTPVAMPAVLPDVVLTADESYTLHYTITDASWVTAVSRSNTTLFNNPATGSTSDLRTQPTSGGTTRTLRIRPSDQSTRAGRYGASTVTLGFTGSGAPEAQTFNVRVNPRAVVDNNLLAIPGCTNTFDVLANDVIPLAGHTFTITSVSTPANGTLEITHDGTLLRYTPANLATGFDTFSYTVTVSSADEFNGYQFTGIGYVKIGGYIVVDSPTASQHIDLDFDYVNGRWSQIIRTDAVVGGSLQSGTFSPSVLDADEGVIFLDPTTKMARPAAPILDALGVPAGADVWVGPSNSGGNKAFIGIASESTAGVEAYTPVGDPRATSNSAWMAIRLVRFSGPGHFAALEGGDIIFDTFDGLNSANDADAGGNVSDTFWGYAGSHAHPAWYFTAPGRYALTFQTTVKANGAMVTSPETTFYVDVDTISGDLRLGENPPQALPDELTLAEDSLATPVNVIANDTSAPDGYEVLSLTAVDAATHGTTELQGDGLHALYTPAPDFNGTDSFTYTVTDEHGGTATGTVTVTVTPVNGMPSFVKGADIEHLDNPAGPQSIAAWATDIDDGDPEVAQALTFHVQVTSGASLFTVAPAVSADGTLSYTLSGEHGTATVAVSLTDDETAGGDALTSAVQTFTITNAEPPLFTIIALGTLGGNTSSALDVNNLRQVSGNSLVSSDPGSTGSLLRAYLWTSGSMTNLGSMAPIPPSTSTNRFGRGYAVNDAGVVVGEFNNDSSRAFVYSGGVMSGLTRLAGDTDNGVALDINNSNVIVGSSSNGTASKATRWTYNGSTYVPSDLGTLAGTATATGRATAINENGAVAGQSTNSAGTTQATLWNGASIINLTSLGDGTRFSQAYGLNESLEVVGSSSTGQTVGELIGTGSSTSITRAFHWQDGVITELPPFNLYSPTNNGATTNYHSVANDINDAGTIVGNSQRIAGSPAVATMWENGVPVNLNTLLPPGSGWVLTNADGINERGDITGTGTFGGFSRAFLLERRAVNDMPSFIKGPDLAHFGSNSGLRTFASWATAINDGDVEVEQTLTFNVNVVSGSVIFSVPPAVSADGTLTYTLSGASGIATVEISLTDDETAGGDALTTPVQSFNVTSFASVERRLLAGVHTDAIAVFAEEDGLVLGTKADIDGQLGVRLDPDEILFNVEEITRSTVSSQPEYAFLGAAGSDVWIAPQTNPEGAVLWPGVSTEGVPAGFADDDQVTLTLESVSGPGTFHLYQTDAFDMPTRLLSSTGMDYRNWTLNAGQHAHAHWAFSAAGTYHLTFSVAATVDSTPVTAVQTYTFIVGDVPSVVATATTLGASPQVALVDGPVQLNASVTPVQAFGYVEFLNGATVIGQAVLNNGSASMTTSSLALGEHTLTARFMPVWANDFSASTSAPVTVTVTDDTGLPFSISGVAASYAAGDTLNAQVVGHTLEGTQTYRWLWRAAGSSVVGSNVQTSTATTYTRNLSASDGGYELSVTVRQGSTVVAQSAWVPVVVGPLGDALVGELQTPASTFVGMSSVISLSGRTLGMGESYEVVRRNTGALWQAFPISMFEGNLVTIFQTNVFEGQYAVRVMSGGVAVAQTAPLHVGVQTHEVQIAGVNSVYRPGRTLTATGVVYPGGEHLLYRWQYKPPGSSALTTLKEGYGQEALSVEMPNLTLGHNGGVLFLLALANSGPPHNLSNLNAGQVNVFINVVDSDPDLQLFTFQPLAGHYHQGDNVNLVLGADPALAEGDSVFWEWQWPGGEWAPFPGVSGLSHQIQAEQALNGVKVRATLVYADVETQPVIASPVTIYVDDHGAAARQKPTIAGVTSYASGDQVTLTRELPANGPTILTTHLWERKAAGAAEFSPVVGQTGAALSIMATMADNGAEYRVSIRKPDGALAYGPSPAVTLSVTPQAFVPFGMPAIYGGTSGKSSNTVVAADFTGDGLPDLITVAGLPGTLTLLKNAGDGTFLSEQAIHPENPFYTSYLFATDYDGDGHMDLLAGEMDSATLSGSASNGEIVVYLNDGSGQFERQVLLGGFTQQQTRILVADLDGDGRDDILQVESATTLVYRRALAEGGFAPPEIIHSGFTSLGSFKAADLDGDGSMDIVTTDLETHLMKIFANDGDGNFTMTSDSLVLETWADLAAVEDVTGDGLPDLVTTSYSSIQARVFVQQSDGSFAASTLLIPDNNIYSVAVGDMNNDGIPDLVSARYSSMYELRLHLGLGGGTFGPPQTILPDIWFPNSLRLVDVNADGSLDVVVGVSSAPGPVIVLLNSSGNDSRSVIPPASRAYVEGDFIEVGIHFGYPVTVDGTPRIPLQIGEATVYADYVSGSGRPSLLFRYTVTSEDMDLDGVQLASAQMDLNGGTLQNMAGAAVDLTIPAVTFEGVIVNGSGPMVTGVTRLDPTPTNAPWLRYNVQFTQEVMGVDASDFELVMSAGDLSAASIQSVSGSGSSYEVLVTTGTGSGTLALSIKDSASITNAAGATLAKGYVGGEVYTLRRGVPKVINAFYSSGHADYRPTWNSGSLGFTLHGAPGLAENVPVDEVITYANATAIVTRPAAATYDFLGVPAGSPLHIINSSGSVATVPYLGFSGESVPNGTFARYLNTDPRINATNAYMKVQMVDMRSSTGGDLSIYSISGGNPRVWMATSDGISSTDAFFLRPGSHSHYNVAFSKPGVYEVDVFVSGYRDTNGNTTYDPIKDPYVESGIYTMVYGVDFPGGQAPVTLAMDMSSRAPVAMADSFEFAPGSVYSGNVLTNDSDPQGDTLSALIKTQAANGTVTLSPDGSFVYAPHAAGYLGTDSFTYYVHDGKGAWSEALASLSITPLQTQDTLSAGQSVEIVLSVPAGGKATVTGLPPGLKYNARTQTITGRTKSAGIYLISVTVRDAQGVVTTTTLPVTVMALPSDIVGKFIGYVESLSTGSNTERSGGRLDLTITALGSYTLKVTHGASVSSHKGFLDLSQEVPAIQASLRSGFTLDMLLENDGLTGTATSGPVTAAVSGWRSVHDARLNPASAQQGYYTVGMEQLSASEGHPSGHGFLAIKIGADGRTTVTGKTADGSAITTTGFLGADGSILVHKSLYAKQGSLAGTLELELDPAGAYLENTVQGALNWAKPELTKGRSSLESGFSLPLQVFGKYMGTGAKNTLLGLPAPGSLTRLAFSSPVITGMAPDVDGIELLYPNMKCVVPTNPARTTLKLAKTTGALSGGYTLVDGTVRRGAKFQGLVIRDPAGNVHGMGFTLLPMLPEAGQPAAKTQIVSGSLEWRLVE